MIIELTLMTLSALIIIALFVHKYLEVSKNIKTVVNDVREKTDPVLRDIHHKGGKFLSYINLQNFILLLNYVFVHIVRFFMNVSHQIHEMSSKIVEKAAKRTGDLSKGGAASFYLKQIKDSKDIENNGEEDK